MADILLIEPDRLLAETYAQALVAAGHRVVVCAGAQPAILAADARQPDLVIVELQLIEHSGIEFLYEFRSYEDWQTIPVIIQTQVPPGEFRDTKQLLQGELGVGAYLYKPQTSLRQLLAAVSEQLPGNSVNQLLARGIVLSRTDYGEADRILTLLTPDHGKLRLMARGVRKPRSKLAGGIELFSVSDITFIRGRGEIGTLISSRLLTYYDHIVRDIGRVQLGYELIKILNKATEDQPEPEYFELLQQAFAALNDQTIDQTLIRLWFSAQLLRQAGHWPNLQATMQGEKLVAGQTYNFDYEDVSFTPHEAGTFNTDDIKFLRLAFSGNPPKILTKVAGSEALTPVVFPLIQAMLQTYIRL